METKDFNQSAELARYSYQRSPIHPRAFQIMRYDTQHNLEPVGDYTVLDKKEDLDLSEKKVMNLVSLLNGHDDLLQLGDETGSRQLYHLIQDGSDGDLVKVMFYQYTGEGCSTENALFTLEGGKNVFH